jgi:hypothetical protein
MTKVFFFCLMIAFCVEMSSAQSSRIRSSKDEIRLCPWTDVESGLFKTSKISGIVTDQNDAFIPSVRLILRSPDGSRVALVKSDKKGNFAFPLVSPGQYFLKARWSKPGFNCKEIEIEVSGSIDRPRRLILEVSPVEVLIEH